MRADHRVGEVICSEEPLAVRPLSHTVLGVLSSHSPVKLHRVVPVTLSWMNSLNSEVQALGLLLGPWLGFHQLCIWNKIILTVLSVTVARMIPPRDQTSRVPEAAGKTTEQAVNPFGQDPNINTKSMYNSKYT